MLLCSLENTNPYILSGGERLPGRRKGTIRVFPLLLSGNLSPKKFPGMTLKTELFKKFSGIALKTQKPKNDRRTLRTTCRRIARRDGSLAIHFIEKTTFSLQFHKPQTQKPKNPKTQKPRNPKLQTQTQTQTPTNANNRK